MKKQNYKAGIDHNRLRQKPLVKTFFL